jgi:N-acetyl-anhydromuramyl-L-alanine amidase AmpD
VILLQSPQQYPFFNAALREKRLGICLHFDGSSSDVGALSWLTKHPDAKVSYHILITRDGVAHQLVPLDARAWHMGSCRPSGPRLRYRDANSAFYGVAIAHRGDSPATKAQVAAVIEVCRMLAERERWNLAAEPWRITGHGDEAWPRGRKVDPIGSDPSRPVLDPAAIRAAFTPPPPALAAA